MEIQAQVGKLKDQIDQLLLRIIKQRQSQIRQIQKQDKQIDKSKNKSQLQDKPQPEQPPQNINENKIPDDIYFNFGKDQDAGDSIADGGLKIAYELILNLAYTLFIAAIGITVTYNISFRDLFVAYVQQSRNKGFIIALAVLGVIVIALSKMYSQKTKFQAHTKKIINFIQDIVRGATFVVMLIFVTQFVIQNYSESLLVLSYILYIVSGSLFFTVRMMKWIYFLCGGGKDNLVPWSGQSMPVFSKFNRNQLQQFQIMVRGIIKNAPLKELNIAKFLQWHKSLQIKNLKK